MLCENHEAMWKISPLMPGEGGGGGGGVGAAGID